MKYKLRYLVPKHMICLPDEEDKESTNLPDDFRVKIIDANRIKSQAEKVPTVEKSSTNSNLLPAVKQDGEIDLSYFPKTFRTKAQWLLQELKRKGLRYNEKYEIYKGETILPGTNILELINDILGRRKNSNPIGIDHFMDLLREYNIPRDLIQNKRRLIKRTKSPGINLESLSKKRKYDVNEEISNDSFESAKDYDAMFKDK